MPKSLDEIMDERVSAPESTETTTVETPNPAPEKPEPQPEKPAEPENPKDDGQEPEPTPDLAAEGNQTVPLKALQEERRIAKELKEQNASFQQQLMQMQQMLLQMQQPQAKQPEPEKVPEFWEDPNGFVTHALTPVQQAMERQRVQTSKLIASSQTPIEDLDAMDLELAQAAQADPAIAAEAQRIARSEHPYGELVKWHRQRKLLTEIGTDPNAYEQRIREKVLAELQAQQPAPVTPTQPAAQTVMPSSFAAARNQGGRATPAYGGPQPLSAITRGSAQ